MIKEISEEKQSGEVHPRSTPAPKPEKPSIL
jgi:hypothetical protein